MVQYCATSVDGPATSNSSWSWQTEPAYSHLHFSESYAACFLSGPKQSELLTAP